MTVDTHSPGGKAPGGHESEFVVTINVVRPAATIIVGHRWAPLVSRASPRLRQPDRKSIYHQALRPRMAASNFSRDLSHRLRRLRVGRHKPA
jgi:hypothetical protein